MAGRVIACARCRSCHAEDTQEYINSKPERKARQREQSKRWYKTVSEERRARLLSQKRDCWHMNRDRYKANARHYRKLEEEHEQPPPPLTLVALSGDKFVRAVNHLLRG